MPSIKLAKNIGFCSGVKRAIDIVENALLRNNRRIYSLGPVIHNQEVIKRLEGRNLRIINSLETIEEKSTLVLPSHGSPRCVLNTAGKKKLKLIDVACPYVSSVQKICKMLYRKGFQVVIIGDAKHPEIKALVDLAKSAYVIEKIKDVPENRFSHQRLGIIAQTTQSQDVFFGMVGEFLQKNPRVKEVRIFNTICLDTINRQEEAKRLASCVDVLLIIGSQISANTRRLLSISRKINKRSYLVETKNEPLLESLKGIQSIGIISGASTPYWLIRDIVSSIRKNNVAS